MWIFGAVVLVAALLYVPRMRRSRERRRRQRLAEEKKENIWNSRIFELIDDFETPGKRAHIVDKPTARVIGGAFLPHDQQKIEREDDEQSEKEDDDVDADDDVDVDDELDEFGDADLDTGALFDGDD